VVTVAVITCLLLTQAPALGSTANRVIPERHRAWLDAVAADAAKAVSGYMLGNLLISVFAGAAAFILLLVLGVPSPVVLAIWVAFADLIPLVGATLGAVIVIFAAFLHSPTAGIISVIFFLAYQQFENSVLQVMIMARTVRVNPLAVILSVLLGVELFGFVGALLAIPAAGAMQVVIKELWRHRPRDADRLVVIGNDSGDVLHIGAEEVIVQDRRRWLRWPFRRAVAGPRKQT
jgi:predicted PurR-regulated permease PerM